MFRVSEFEVGNKASIGISSFDCLLKNKNDNRINDQIKYLEHIKKIASNQNLNEIKCIVHSSPALTLLLLSVSCITIDSLLLLFSAHHELKDNEKRNIYRGINQYIYVIESLNTSKSLMYQNIKPIMEYREKYSLLSKDINSQSVQLLVNDAIKAIQNSEYNNLNRLMRFDPLLFMSSNNY